jgi:hypothetical protein
MMKKLFTLLLAMCLLASTAFATVADPKEEDMLDWKLSKQISNGSGLRIKLSFEQEGGFPKLDMPANQAVLLGALSDGTALQLNYLTAAFGLEKGRQEVNLNLSKGEKTLTGINYRSDGGLEAVSSPLFGKDTYLAAEGESAAILLGEDAKDTWPDISRLLFSIYTADNEWKTSLDHMLAPYQADIANLIQQNTQLSTEQQADGSVNTLTNLSIPAANMKSSIVQMLRNFYQDEQLITHLKQKATVREQNAFLNPALLDSLIQAVNAMNLEGDVTVKRSFEKDGTLVYDNITLPMGNAKGLKNIEYLYSVKNSEGSTAVTLNYGDGAYKTFSYNHVKNSINSGKITGTLKQKQSDALEEKQMDISVDYLRNMPVYDAQTDKYSQDYSANITLTEKGKNANIITGYAKLVSGSNPRSATSITGDISWSVEGQDSKLNAQIEGASTPPWSIKAIEEGEYLRVEELTEEQLKKLQETVQLNLAAIVAGLNLTNLPVVSANPQI